MLAGCLRLIKPLVEIPSLPVLPYPHHLPAPLTNLVGLLVLLSEIGYKDIGIGTHVCPRGRVRARGVHPRFHELGVGRAPEILLDQITGATLRQPCGQRLRLRRHLLPAAVFRGGGGVCYGEVVKFTEQSC